MMLTPFQDDLLQVLPSWISDPIRSAPRSSVFRKGSCDVARMVLAHFRVDNDDIRTTLHLAEAADSQGDVAAAIQNARNIVDGRYRQSQELEEDMIDLEE